MGGPRHGLVHATVTIAVGVTAVDDNATTPTNTTLTATTVLANDGGSGLRVMGATAPDHGTLTMLVNGTFTFVPDTGYSGPDSFTYTSSDSGGQTSTATVFVTVTPRTSGDSFITAANVTLNGTSVLAGDPTVGLTVTSNTNPSHGTLTVLADGTFTYVPTPNSSGPDSFTYTAADSSGQTSTATVTIDVSPVSADDAATTTAGTAITPSRVLANDAGSGLTVMSNTSPALGTVVIARDGTYTYTPNPGVSGIDTFTYTATDAFGAPTTATVSVSVTPVAADDTVTTVAGVAVTGSSVLTNDVGSGLSVSAHTNPAVGALTIATNGTFTYVPAAGSSSNTTFTYTTIDGDGQSDTATVTISVTPTAGDDTGQTGSNTPLTGSVLGNDIGSSLVVTSNTSPVHGTLTIAGDGTYSYTPFLDYSGTDSFSYMVTDSDGETANATVSLAVGPRAVDDTGATFTNVTLTGASLFANDDGDALALVANTSPANGTVAIAADGTYTYDPAPGFSGIDTFTYTVTSSTGQDDTATVTVTVRPTFIRVMRPASSSTSRCFSTAGSLIAKGCASALTDALSSRSSRARIARRVGSTSAENVRPSRS